MSKQTNGPLSRDLQRRLKGQPPARTGSKYNDTTKKFAVKFKKSERPIRDKNGTVLTWLDKQLNRWAEHFAGAAYQTKTT